MILPGSSRAAWLLLGLAAVGFCASTGCQGTPAVGSDGGDTPPWWRGADPQLIRCPLGGTVLDVEAQVIVPKCGALGDNTCHGTGPIPPRFAEAGMIAANVIDVMPQLRCRRDKLVSRAEPAKSDLLAKIRARGGSALCTDGSDGGPGMPFQDAPPLTADQAACLEWWVHEIVK